MEYILKSRKRKPCWISLRIHIRVEGADDRTTHKVVAHFCHKDFRRCQIIDTHMEVPFLDGSGGLMRAIDPGEETLSDKVY